MLRSRCLTRGSRALACLCAALAAGCAVNPATSKNQLMLVSESQEIEMGRQYDSQVVETIGLYPDPAWQTYIQQLGARLAATSERPSLPWTFRVVNDPAVNAFALPGGFVYVTRGILAHLNSEAQLASVLGHEIGHITARHSAAEMSKQQLAGLGLAIGSMASSDVARYAGAANQALGVLFLKFSRDNESQADDLGLRYMGRANYDPREMSAVFVMLDQQAQGARGRLPEWLETHPAPARRLHDIGQQIAALPQDFSGTVVSRDPYERRLDGLVFGINPREGFFRGSHFLHPDLRFQLTFPEGWTTNNGSQAVIAVSAAKDAAIELSQANEASAAAAARAFLSQQGITSGGSSGASVGGLPAVSAPFAAATDQGSLRGTVLFVEYGSAVYRLIAYAPEARWSANQAAAGRTLHSFQRLTDPATLNIQPHHVDIVTLDRRTTIGQLARVRSSPVAAERLALINQVAVETAFASGRLVKWVIGVAHPL